MNLANQIFDALYTEKLIQLDNGHQVPKAEDLKGKEFCKLHSSWRHSTNNCIVFQNVIQESIDKGLLKFVEKQMGVDTNPFPEVTTNMVMPDLSELSKPQQKIDVGQTSNPPKETLRENKFGGTPARIIHDLKQNQEEKQKVESIYQTDLSTKSDLFKKTTDELIDKIREQ